MRCHSGRVAPGWKCASGSELRLAVIKYDTQQEPQPTGELEILGCDATAESADLFNKAADIVIVRVSEVEITRAATSGADPSSGVWSPVITPLLSILKLGHDRAVQVDPRLLCYYYYNY